MIIFSASKALTKWLQIELPRLPSTDGKRIGTQPLVTDSDTVSWQCHVVKNSYKSDKFTVIAVEAYSRFTVLLPFDVAPTQAELEERLCVCWATVLITLMITHGEIGEDQADAVFSQCNKKMHGVQWWRNTDLSVNGHVTDAEQWVKQTIDDRRVDALSDEEAFDLAMHINQFFKRVKNKQGKKPRFYPIPRFVEDGLFRFASGIFKGADFTPPVPAKISQSKEQSNVISLAGYRARKCQ